jgi:hypothetical protein
MTTKYTKWPQNIGTKWPQNIGNKWPKTIHRYQMTTNYTKLPWNLPNCHEIYQIAMKSTKMPWNLPNCHEIYQNAMKSTKWPWNQPNCHKIFQAAIQLPTFTIPRPSKIYPNLVLNIYHLATLRLQTVSRKIGIFFLLCMLTDYSWSVENSLLPDSLVSTHTHDAEGDPQWAWIPHMGAPLGETLHYY